MEGLMLFIEQNALWVILIFIFLCLAIIGYIAEKSGYKKVERPKNEKKETPKEEKKEETVTPISTQDFDFHIPDTLEQDAPSTPKETETVLETPKEEVEEKGAFKKKKKKKKKKDSEEPKQEEVKVEAQPVLEPVLEPMAIPQENLEAPLTPQTESEPKLEEIPQDLYAPIGDLTFEKPAQPMEANQVGELPNLDQIKDSNQEVTSEDDIWKF